MRCFLISAANGIVRQNLTDYQKAGNPTISTGKLAPFSKRGGAALFENIAPVSVTVEIEMVVKGYVEGRKFLQGADVPETGHRPFAPLKWLM